MLLGIFLVLDDHVDFAFVSSIVGSVVQAVDHAVDVVVPKAVDPITYRFISMPKSFGRLSSSISSLNRNISFTNITFYYVDPYQSSRVGGIELIHLTLPHPTLPCASNPISKM